MQLDRWSLVTKYFEWRAKIEIKNIFKSELTAIRNIIDANANIIKRHK